MSSLAHSSESLSSAKRIPHSAQSLQNSNQQIIKRLKSPSQISKVAKQQTHNTEMIYGYIREGEYSKVFGSHLTQYRQLRSSSCSLVRAKESGLCFQCSPFAILATVITRVHRSAIKT